MANIFSLFGTIFIDNEKANSAIDTTTEKAENSGSKVGAAFSGIAKGAAKVATGVVTAAAAIGAGAYKMATSAAENADVIDKMSERTGINREELQRWMHACDQSGVNADVLETAVKKMSSTLDDAAQGSSSANDALLRLGVSLDDLNGKNVEEKFDIVTNALANMENGTERNALGADLLGKAYTEMLPLLNAGAEGIKDLKNEADELGIVMSESAVKSGVKLGDTIANVKASFSAILNRIGIIAIPIIQKFADMIIAKLPQIQNVVAKLEPILNNIFDEVLPPLFDLVDSIFPLLVDLVSELLPVIVEIVQELLPIVVDLIKEILPVAVQIVQRIMPIIISVLNALLPILGPLIELLTPILNIVVALLNPLISILEMILPPLVNIITNICNVVLPILNNALQFVAELLAERFGVAIEAITTVFENVKKIFTNILDFVKNVFTGQWSAAWDNIKNIFVAIWDNIKTAVKAPINFIIDGINKLIRGLNKISFTMPDWLGGKSFGINIPTIPRLRRGMDYVPYDDFPALLHRGESVKTASETKSEREESKDIPPQQIIVEKVEIHIEHFNGEDTEDIDDFVDIVMDKIDEKINRKQHEKGGV